MTVSRIALAFFLIIHYNINVIITKSNFSSLPLARDGVFTINNFKIF
jgi:hypothetical protein